MRRLRAAATVIAAVLVAPGCGTSNPSIDEGRSSAAAGSEHLDPALSATPPAELTRSSTGNEQGVVKWFNREKGYGYITRPNGAEIFVHYGAILSSGYRKLSPGDVVEYVLGQGPRGDIARDVHVVG
jgi:CspA family cold shock protein